MSAFEVFECTLLRLHVRKRGRVAAWHNAPLSSRRLGPNCGPLGALGPAAPKAKEGESAEEPRAGPAAILTPNASPAVGLRGASPASDGRRVVISLKKSRQGIALHRAAARSLPQATWTSEDYSSKPHRKKWGLSYHTCTSRQLNRFRCTEGCGAQLPPQRTAPTKVAIRRLNRPLNLRCKQSVCPRPTGRLNATSLETRMQTRPPRFIMSSRTKIR